MNDVSVRVSELHVAVRGQALRTRRVERGPLARGARLAFPSATDISVFVSPRMAHMHNFAGSRERLWARVHAWGDAVRNRNAGS